MDDWDYYGRLTIPNSIPHGVPYTKAPDFGEGLT